MNSLMKMIGKDCEDIINQYVYELEHSEKLNVVMKEMKKYIKERRIDYGFIKYYTYYINGGEFREDGETNGGFSYFSHSEFLICNYKKERRYKLIEKFDIIEEELIIIGDIHYLRLESELWSSRCESNCNYDSEEEGEEMELYGEDEDGLEIFVDREGNFYDSFGNEVEIE